MPTLKAEVPSENEGSGPAKAYELGKLDSINLFNGNLSIKLPIGPTNPVGEGLSYRLQLVYNSKMWKFDVSTPGQDVPDLIQGTPKQFNNNNAGLGWGLSLGALEQDLKLDPSNSLDPIATIYHGPDSSETRFYRTLHENADGHNEPVDPYVAYSRDGTYMRLSLQTGRTRQLEFRDGTIQTFDATGQLTSIKNRFAANWITISYPSNRWVIADQTGRTCTVTFVNSNVSSVSFAAFTPPGSPARPPAVYNFSYSNVTIARPWPASETDAAKGGKTIQISLLTKVAMPDGTSVQMSAASDYITNLPWGFGSETNGVLTGLQLPTTGRLQYQYGYYSFPTEATKFGRTSSPGVVLRRTKDNGGNVLGTWTYSPKLTRDPNFPNQVRYVEEINTVTDPSGNVVAHYFSADPSQPDYGFPYSTLRPGPAGKFLSTEVNELRSPGGLVKVRATYLRYEHDRTPTTTNFDIETTVNTNLRLAGERTVFLDDASSFTETERSNFDGFGHYRKQVVSGSFASGDVTTSWKNFNPWAGQYSLLPTGATAPGFTMLPSTQPWVLDTYPDASTSDGQQTFGEQFCFESATGFLSRERKIKSTDASLPLGPNDILITRERTNSDFTGDPTSSTAIDNGFSKAENLYGGDYGSVGTGSDVCSVQPGPRAYRIEHQYQYGTLLNTKTAGADFFSVDRTNDPTGLVAVERDAAGILTRYDYDAMGRRTWTKPEAGQGAWLEVDYGVIVNAGDVSKVVLRSHPNGDPSTDLTRNEKQFDSFGRVRKELYRRNATDDVTTHTYDAAGHKTFDSSRGDPANGTTYSNFDAFGRPGTIKQADGSIVTIKHYGARQVTTTSMMGTGETSPGSGTIVQSPAMNDERFDHRGRLYEVHDPSGSVATYTHDAVGHVTNVSMSGFAAASDGSITHQSITQVRRFGYDGRGFLRWSTEPELESNRYTPSGEPANYPNNSSNDYLEYDPLGNVGLVVSGDNTLSYSYDVAGRLFQVSEAQPDPVTSSSTRILKKFVYGSGASAGDRSKGKIVNATRFNYPFSAAANATQKVGIAYTYSYAGVGGRASQRDLLLSYNDSSVGTESFTQSWTYNDLGKVSNIGYPQCTFTPCSSNQRPVFADVPLTDPYRPDVEALYFNGVTAGCGGGNFCPQDTLTRGETSVFMLKLIEGGAYTPPACTTAAFPVDVPCTSPFAPWVNEFARRGYTSGCGGGSFCVNNAVSRGEMAVFLLLAKHGIGYQPPACTANPYADVICGHTGFDTWIAETKSEGIMSGCGGGNFCPTTPPTREQEARILDDGLGILRLSSAAAPRSVHLSYHSGLLTGVGSYASLAYYPNQMLSQATLANGHTWNQTISNGMPRPSTITVDGAGGLSYQYDGSGNPVKVGAEVEWYDLAGQLVSSRDGSGITQSFSYDGFGNLQHMSSSNPLMDHPAATDSTTNRLLSATYDRSGNMKSWGGVSYSYDGLNKLNRRIDSAGTQDWLYIYDADDQRVLSFYAGSPRFDRWTIRDLDHKVLRTFETTSWAWNPPTIVDDIYRGNALVAEVWPSQLGGNKFNIVDHLGSPRIIYDGFGNALSHYYRAYGEETATNPDQTRLKFAGHERDFANDSVQSNDLDYVSERYYNPQIGRFLSTDPAGHSARSEQKPQSWNRYEYAENSPVRLFDTDGREPGDPFTIIGTGRDIMEYVSKVPSAQLNPVSPAALETFNAAGGGTGTAQLSLAGDQMTNLIGSRLAGQPSIDISKVPTAVLDAEGRYAYMGEQMAQQTMDHLQGVSVPADYVELASITSESQAGFTSELVGALGSDAVGGVLGIIPFAMQEGEWVQTNVIAPLASDIAACMEKAQDDVILFEFDDEVPIDVIAPADPDPV